jgi:hypothetical protein
VARAGAPGDRALTKAMPTRPLVPALFAIACFATEADMADSVDGTYVGERVLTKGDPSGCLAQDTVSVTIHGEQLTFTNSAVKDYTISFSPHPDGSFGELSANIGGDVVAIHGRAANGVLDADVAGAHCEYHWHLKKG